MDKDFYLDDRALAAYFEKDWLDRTSGRVQFAFAPFPPELLHSNDHVRLVEFLAARSDAPVKVLEIGSSLGRTFFELCQSFPSLRHATLVEPSRNLERAFRKIFAGEALESFAVLKGNLGMGEATLNTLPVRAACSHVAWECLNVPFQEMRGKLDSYDLVICANVIDQCHEPMELVKLLRAATAPGGQLLLSCTYQWQDKYLGNAGVEIKDIHELFDSSWKSLGEINLPFRCRVYERYWMHFLSHAVLYRKLI